MFHNNRKTIGVFAFRPSDPFQKKTCQGIIEEAQERGYNVAFFSSFGRHDHNKRFVNGEKQILSLPPYEDLDGVIVATDTMDIAGTKEELVENIRSWCHCPVVSLRENVEGFHTLGIDDDAAMEDMVMHFVEVHEFTKFCFMSGPLDMEEARARLSCFQRIMKAYGLPVTEQQIFYGNFWTNCGADACDHFYQDGYQPEVIICANDYMAQGVSTELLRRGYRIPEDVCVSGFDGIPNTLFFSPSITTVEVPFYEMGKEAVRLIADEMKKPSEDQEIIFPTRLVLNESCGCYTLQKQELILNRCRYFEKNEADRNRRTAETFMSINLQEVDSLSMLSGLIKDYVVNVEGYESYFLCLCEGLEDATDSSALKGYTDMMHMMVGFHEREYMGEVDLSFERKDLLPEDVCGLTPQVFFFMPLHYKEHCFGYQAVSFLESTNAGNLFLPWIVSIENAIENIILQSERESMIGELEYLYVRDSLTDLFNRRGLDKYGIPLWERAIQEKKPLFVMGIDLDDMKEINDTYGHKEGDNALKIISEAIQFAAETNDVGDEFAIIGYGKTEKDVEVFQEKLLDYVDAYNKSKKRPYEIHASFGIYYKIPSRNMSLEMCMQNSDRKMYANKAKYKEKRGK